MWSAPLLAQSADPLAPITTQPANPVQPSSPPIVTATPSPAPIPVATVQVPRDWRGVFDAIDSGNWESAQAGIAVLPRSVLTPVAKAELYTAKGSPQVDLGSIQSLLAEAPGAAPGRPVGPARHRPRSDPGAADHPELPVVNLGSPPGRYRARRPGRAGLDQRIEQSAQLVGGRLALDRPAAQRPGGEPRFTTGRSGMISGAWVAPRAMASRANWSAWGSSVEPRRTATGSSRGRPAASPWRCTARPWRPGSAPSAEAPRSRPERTPNCPS